MTRRKFPVALAAGLAAGCSDERTVAAGSKNFTEQVILGEIIAQHLEQRLALRVRRRLNLGGTLLAHQALVSGQIDLYPEYTGTALTAILDLPAASDAARVFGTVRSEYRRRWGIEWLDPLGFDNTFAMVIRGADARRGGLTTLSAAAKARAWNLGAGYEFVERPDGLAALVRTYGLRLARPAATMDLGLLYRALEQGQVDMVAGSATDGLLSARDFVVLKDDRQAFPPYQAAIAVRSSTLAGNPQMRGALDGLTGKISEETMRKLNYEVDVEHHPVAATAKGWLAHASASAAG